MAMNTLVSEKQNELVALCHLFRVKRLELFGSAATSEFDPKESDVDFLVVFQEMSPSDHSNAYFGLLADLETLFSRRVDLVEYKAIDNPYFLEAVETTRTLLYAA
jgi:predicted nucleotidyltransferase